MLVLSRKIEQKIQIGDNITITVLRVDSRNVKIGIEAPESVRVMRSEVLEKLAQAVAGKDAAGQAALPNQRVESSTNSNATGTPSVVSESELAAEAETLCQTGRLPNLRCAATAAPAARPSRRSRPLPRIARRFPMGAKN